MEKSRDWFARFAHLTAAYSGHPITFAAAVAIVIGWGVTGPFFGFNDSWQLVINTGTTIVTFLLVFLIQHTQNRDTMALNAKLDELIRAIGPARDAFRHVESLSAKEIQELRDRLDGQQDERDDP